MGDVKQQVVEYNATEAALTELRKELAGRTYDVTTKEGMAAARAARFKLVKLRTALEDKRVAIKEPLLVQTRLIDSEAKRITAELLVLEKPIDDQIKAHERAEAEKKAAAERAEQERRNTILAQIQRLENLPATLVGKPVAELAAALMTLGAEQPEGWAQEFAEKAKQVHTASVAKIGQMHAAAVAAEAEAKRQAAERERLAKEAAELEHRAAEQRAAEDKAKAEREAAEAESRRRIEEQERQARLAREEEDRKAREALEAERRKAAEELARKEAALKAQQEKLDAERRAKEEAEHQAKLAKEREAEEKARAERERQEQERIALEKRQREEQEAREAEEREVRRVQQERADGYQLLADFVDRFGHNDEFRELANTIRHVLVARRKAA